jgi:hypothetical protein
MKTSSNILTTYFKINNTSNNSETMYSKYAKDKNNLQVIFIKNNYFIIIYGAIKSIITIRNKSEKKQES